MNFCRWQSLVMMSILNTYAWMSTEGDIPKNPACVSRNAQAQVYTQQCWLELHCSLGLTGLLPTGGKTRKELRTWSWVSPSEKLLKPEQVSFLWNTPEQGDLLKPWNAKVTTGEVEPGKVITNRCWAWGDQSWKSLAFRRWDIGRWGLRMLDLGKQGLV